jgi:hypothetical protein
MTTPATAPEATMPARGLCPRQRKLLIHNIAEILHTRALVQIMGTPSARYFLVSPSDDEPTRCSTWRTRDEEHVVYCHVTTVQLIVFSDTNRKHAIAA